MKPNRQLLIMKIHSARLKDQKFNLSLSFDEAKRSSEIVALADNQILRSIRDMTGKVIDYDLLEQMYDEREQLKHLPNSRENRKRIGDIQKNIDRTLYIDAYKIVVIDHPSHYRYIFENGVRINGRLYRRFSCSAGQARKSNVILLDVELLDRLRERLNNGRNMNVAFSPSKFNAYFGLYGSATKLVSEPRFIVVKDFENKHKMRVNFVTETDWNQDDDIHEDEVELSMDRMDGMGLISPQLSQKWAEELGLDYVPSQWCVRQSFIKGMLCTFPIHEFCEEVNQGNYIVDTIYKDVDGNPIQADLRDYDVIISESQFKLWNSYDSIDSYIENCHKNKLFWGVTQYTPKVAKDKLRLNYQFVQTLNLDQAAVERLCEQFVRWVQGVSYENWNSMLLFLLGQEMGEERIQDFMRSSDSYWIKSLILYPELRNDKFVKEKIKELLRVKIRNACLGEIFVDGNFQVIVSDPYGFMQSVCGLPVTGLLKDGEFYSNYWNERGVTQVDSMRSPLTYRSEHVVLNLRKDEETEKWYRYCKLGIILNFHGHECVNYAGSDFDYDILSTTSNQTMIQNTYKDELPVYYVPPKPKKIVFEERDLYNADCFSFGSIIGQITNKSSNAYALLPNLEKRYGKNSLEVKMTVSRLKQCCKAQSAQIDKRFVALRSNV